MVLYTSKTIFRPIFYKIIRNISNNYTKTSFVKNFHLTMSPRPSVYVTRPDVCAESIEMLRKECDVTIWKKNCIVPRDELLRNVCGKNAIYCMLTEKIDSEVLECAGPNLKVIGTMSVGYDHIDVIECKKRGIRIGNTPDVLTDATAELTLALTLATSRRLFEANKEVYNGGWKDWSPNWLCGQGLKNSIIGIVGFGRIGQEVAKRIIPFHPKQIIYSNRSNRTIEAQAINAELVTFDQLIQTSDFIILTCTLTAETSNLINATSLSKMKSNAIIINTSRGGLINQLDLYDALKSEKIRAAGVDVTVPEPLPLDSPLLSLKNFVVLPHIGSADIETRNLMAITTARNILAVLKRTKMIAEV